MSTAGMFAVRKDGDANDGPCAGTAAAAEMGCRTAEDRVEIGVLSMGGRCVAIGGGGGDDEEEMAEGCE